MPYQKLINIGYPSYISYEEISNFMKKYTCNDDFPEQQNELYEALLYSNGFDKNDFKLGSSKLFLRKGKVDILKQLMLTNGDKMIEQLKIFILNSSKPTHKFTFSLLY